MTERVTAGRERDPAAVMQQQQQQDEESAEQAFFRLEEIDELLGGNDSAEEQGKLFTYLRSDTDLATALARQETELRTLCDAFIDAHVAQADNICRLHRDYTECENRLVDFETGIVAFQRRLDATADDMVKMQQQIDDLSRSVSNRKQVSNKINEVYTALQECDAFCEAITTSREVDAHYLGCLQELDHKLSFLCHNKELQHSAVDNELRPRLTAAARKAGDKLQRFLLTEVMSLAEDVEHVEAHQLALEQRAQYAFRFLQLYNQPVAREIAGWYVRHMSEAYLHSFRALLREFAEAAELHAHPLDPMVTAEELYEVMSNRDAGAPAGSQVSAPPGLSAGFAAHTLALRDRSISQHMRLGHADIHGGGGGSGGSTTVHHTLPLRRLREESFADVVCAMRALSVRHGRLHLDATCSAALNECNSWVWRFVRCLQVLVNVCVAECRFIGNFFCVAGDIEGGEDYHGAERMARAVLERTLSTVERAMQLAVPLVLRRSAVLSALRMLDLVRQYLCTSLDPIPLLLLSTLLETTKAALRRSLRLVLHNDELAVDFLPSVRLVAFRRGVDLHGATAGLLAERYANYAATLGPHPLLYRVAEALGELDYLNVAPLQCVTFHSAPTAGVAAYEPLVASFVQGALARLLDFTTALARRHGEDALLQSVFCAVNVFVLLAIWRELRTSNALAGDAERSDSCAPGAIAADVATQGMAATSPSPTAETPSPAAMDDATVLSDEASGDEARVTTSSYMASAAHVGYAEQQLQDHLQRWVAEDQRRRSPFDKLAGLIAKAECELGRDFFKSEPGAQGETRAPRDDGALSEAHIRRLVTDLSTGWQTGLGHMVRETRSVVQVTLGSMSPGLMNGEAGTVSVVPTRLQQWCSDLCNALLHTYLRSLTLANAQLATIVNTFYAHDGELQARLVSNTTLLHEAQRYVREQ